MRRAVLALGGTAAGLAALFSYKTHVPTVTALTTPMTPATESATAPSTSPSDTTPTMKPPATKPAATKSASPKATSPKATETKAAPATSAPRTTAPVSTPTTQAPAPTKSATPAGPSGTFSGQTVDTNYGPVQVTITVSDGKITSASDPDGGDSIGENAIQQLNPEVVQAQSANISAVSGATYTSNGYIQSLQQAIDAAGL
jgi:uncharacterized protein with FMN-binding domain